MRLLNSKTLEIEEFYGDDTPKYAILSHRWLDGEVSLKDMDNGAAKAKAGYNKIKLCCEQAAKDGIGYAWVDTCCIDKTSSAELSEAINCMYNWYEGAQICYVYLSDVHSKDASDPSFAKSAWFTRGWTLQELIAPQAITFYNSKWQTLGTKDSLRVSIAAITDIDLAALQPEAEMHKFSVAKRMSWAAGRRTTRVEDVAYSLLGLFQVNMPMLYGEGKRAFVRLQEEIMKNSDDQSIFAWTNPGKTLRGLLAASPDEFAKCSFIIPSASRMNAKPYAVTNKGLSIQLAMMPWHMGIFLAILDCERSDRPDSKLGIYLHMYQEKDQYARTTVLDEDLQVIYKFSPDLAPRNVYVRHHNYRHGPIQSRLYGFYIRNLPFDPRAVETEMVPSHRWSPLERTVEIPMGKSGTAICIENNRAGFSAKFGFDSEFQPVCYLAGAGVFRGKSKEELMDPSWMTTQSWEVEQNVLRSWPSLGSVVHNGWKIKLLETSVGTKRTWVIDIVDADSDEFGVVAQCDGCNLVSSRSYEASVIGQETIGPMLTAF